ncbi:LytR/AlgR family response regulator transcription factor [Anaerorhabdus furcosa]|uniref:Two component transcriptional regulator, LytTR family n=1 Tax=Anaerorhabdus furcosa TaxID=118967 RepID=A0A1T4NYW0_9FIRM|nr:LytTR family DNA-binding domain-containing protein [Anaerorhabdus furcosa]SJZ84395.1 two component transcriptional regulator, LytTR family [Anaerorhabdus furcosa]
MSLNIAICDNNPYHLNETLSEVMKFCKSIDIKPTVSTYRETTQILKDFIKTEFQILITSTELERTNGIEFAHKINILYPKTRIIFVIDPQQYTTDLYTVNHLYTVFKNDLCKLTNALQKYIDDLNSSIDTLVLSFKGKTSIIPFRNIVYIEKSLRKALFYTTQGNYETYRSTDEILEILPSTIFVQCHRAFLVNMLFIKDLNSNEISLYNGHLIPVGRNYLSCVKQSLNKIEHVDL